MSHLAGFVKLLIKRKRPFWLPCLLFLFSFLLLIPSSINAQSVKYDIVKIPNTRDLSGFSGTDILQDKDGFMWFVSYNGLYRYDGSGFRIYPSDSFDKNTLVEHHAKCMTEDSEGIMWIGTDKNLFRFDKKSELFEKIENIDASSGQPWTGAINCMVLDKSGYIWIGNSRGLSRFDPRKMEFKNYIIDTSTHLCDVWFLCDDGEGTLWLQVGHDRITTFDKETEIHEAILKVPFDPIKIYKDRSGQIWITSWDGLYLIDRSSRTLKRYLHEAGDPDRLPNQVVRDILEDKEGNYWFSTYDGVYLYDQDLNNELSWKYNDVVTPSSGSWPLWTSFYPDKAGTIWFYTREGIFRTEKRQNVFRIYILKSEKVTHVKEFFAEGNNIWFIAKDVLHRLETTTGQLKTVHRISYRNISGIILDSTGIIWIATTDRGLVKVKRSDDGSFVPEEVPLMKADSNGLPGTNITWLFEDGNSRIWIGVEDHLPCYYDRHQERIIHLVNKPDQAEKLPVGVKVQLETKSEVLLATGKDGIFKIYIPLIKVSGHAVTAANITRIKSKENGDPLNPTNIFQSSDDTMGILWITDAGRGLVKFTPKKSSGKKSSDGIFKRYSRNNGLPSNYISDILEDNKGYLWLFTAGLTKFDPVSEAFSTYTVKDGLPINGLSSACKTKSGEIFFGSELALVSFHPDSIHYNLDKPPVLLTGLKVNNTLVSPQEGSPIDKQITYTDQIDLTYKENNLSFEFAALNYIESFDNQYKYIMEGFNSEWINAVNRNHADYTNLKPGKYIFRVIGSNNDGYWNEEGASLHIFIHPPPWQTWWAYCIYVLMIVGIILWYRRYQLNRARLRTAVETERLEKDKMQELDQMKSRFFANISHEFRTPLTLILGPVDNMLRKKENTDPSRKEELGIIHRNAKRLQQLINQLLDISKLETGRIKLEVSEGDLSEFTRRIILSFLSLAESRSIDYRHDVPGIPGKVYFDGDKYEKIVTNLLSNAFKFTPAGGRIVVIMKYEPVGSDTPEYAEIFVRDTGKGIPREKVDKIFDRFYQVSSSDSREYEGTGIGLSLTRELVDVYRGEIRVESEPGKGSVFTVKLPVSLDNFNEKEIVEPPDERIEVAEPEPEILAEATTYEDEVKKGRAVDAVTEKPVILVVEDNADLRKYIYSNLEENYQLLEAGNGRTGLETAIESVPDLVITDLMMPEMDGIELCNRIREDQRINHIPVVMLTAKADRESKLEGLETGADDYLVKPFDVDELQVRVKNLIQQRKNLREKYQQEFIENDPFTIQIPGLEDEFLSQVVDCIQKHIDEQEFSVEQLAREIGFSRSQLHRKLRSMTGYVPGRFIRNIRLKQAARMFREGHKNVTEVLYSVGFNTPSHFTQAFHELFGMNPSDYLNQIRGSSAQ